MKWHRFEQCDVGTSLVHTIAPESMRKKYGSIVVCRNAVKDGMPLMYWTSISIGGIGVFLLDLRELPGLTGLAAERHARELQPHTQRKIALAMVHEAFPDRTSLLTWFNAHAQKMVDWEANFQRRASKTAGSHG